MNYSEKKIPHSCTKTAATMQKRKGTRAGVVMSGSLRFPSKLLQLATTVQNFSRVRRTSRNSCAVLHR